MAQQQRDLVHRWFEEVWNQGRREAIEEMLAADAVIHESEIDSVGPEGFYPFFDRMRATFSDLHLTVEDTITEGDKICVRWSCTAKHTGEGLGMPANGVPVRVTGMSIIRIQGGKLVEGWQNWDMLGLVQQIQGGSKAATYIGEKR